MTPAILAAERARVPFRIHEYVHDPHAASYGLEAAEKLGVDAGCVFKTLLVCIDAKRLAVAVVPAAQSLDLKACAAALGTKKAVMAELAAAERATGYVAGGISPLGQKRRLPLVLDASALAHETIFVSGGRRGLEIELAPADLLALTGGSTAAVAR
jgi:Cys-tRNA(Pro)/Cys-tRNA(Cys) deacylase